ncbi:DDX27 [Cordylochernes scorpioides]|uniref:DDX27 n=1 Tax=Cordylochernes scorpioides TaxID=51811 RepID=A0ABY6K813_9ARAC|nr:DDX27 [Cordylochernes scorpioides]
MVVVAALLSRSFPKRTAVFFNTKKELRRVAEILRVLKFSVGELHGDMKQPKRILALRQFKNGTFDILLATDVAARGIDIKNLETVSDLAWVGLQAGGWWKDGLNRWFSTAKIRVRFPHWALFF